MFDLVWFVLGGFAVWQATEVVRHSTIPLMVWLRSVSSRPKPKHLPWVLWMPVQSIACGWCLSVWAGFGVAAVTAAGFLLGGVFGLLVLVPIAGLGFSALANLLHDISRALPATRARPGLERIPDDQLEQEFARRFGHDALGLYQRGSSPGGEVPKQDSSGDQEPHALDHQRSLGVDK